LFIIIEPLYEVKPLKDFIYYRVVFRSKLGALEKMESIGEYHDELVASGSFASVFKRTYKVVFYLFEILFYFVLFCFILEDLIEY